MIIDSTAIGMESARTYSSISKEAQTISIGIAASVPQSFTESLDKGMGEIGGGKNDETSTQTSASTVADEINSTVSNLYESIRSSGSQRMQSLMEGNLQQRIHDLTLKYLLMLLYGKDSVEASEYLENCRSRNLGASNYVGYGNGGYSGSGGLLSVSNTLSGTVGTVYEQITDYQYLLEDEETTFKTVGTVNTADGRTIEFNIEAIMSRSVMTSTESSIYRNINLIDPLVINLDGDVTSVSDKTFKFDLDCDGEEEELSIITSGSGFLALDRNEDGQINDGGELFGALSGKGFEELSQYDSDGNGWIDEADSVFTKLKIWSIDESGNQKLVDLKAAGVGAVYLGNTATEFTLNDALTGDTDAVIRSTGMFLFEDGTAGTLQQLDMAVH